MESETTEVDRTRTCMFTWKGEDLPTEINYEMGSMTYLGYIKQGTTITGYVEFNRPLRPSFIKLLLTGNSKTEVILTRYKEGSIIEKRARAAEYVNRIGGEITTHGKLKQTVKATKKAPKTNRRKAGPRETPIEKEYRDHLGHIFGEPLKLMQWPK